MHLPATRSSRILAAGLALSTHTVWAQAPVVTTLAPGRHAVAAPALGPVGVSFSQSITAASAPNLRVYGNQRRGRRPGAVSGGNTAALSFAPTQEFAPGERVSVSVPATLRNAAGVGVRAQVYQFTAATGGTGRGVFLDTTEVAPTNSRDQLLGDIDNDGDLDLLTTAGLFGVYSFLNDGTGVFSPRANVVVANTPSGTALADFNQDGFLDLLAGDADNPGVSVALNDGTGGFGVSGFAGLNYTVGGTVSGVAAGDVDGDGDLDFVTANRNTASATVGFNDGTGRFGGLVTVGVSAQPSAVQLVDVDNDGDLDLLTSNRGSNSVSVCLNYGLGNFASGAIVVVGTAPTDLTLGDVDGDGDADLLTANAGAGTLSVCLNNGNGAFGSAATLALPTGGTPSELALGDVDADGDLDVVVAQGTGGQVFTLLNNGNGSFVAQARPLLLAAAGSASISSGVALGDVDGDGDLDLVTSNDATGRVVLARGDAAPVLSGFSPAAGAPGISITLTGTSLTGTRRIVFAGAAGNVVTSGFAVNATGTQITGVTVPNGAITGPVSVTTRGGSAATTASFVVSAAQLTVLQNGAAYLPAGAPYSFGNQELASSSAPVTFALFNPGSLPLLLTGATATGDFALAGPAPAMVAPGGLATLAVVFRPSALGLRTGTLTVTSNAAGFPSYVMALRGTGVVPRPTVSSFTPASAPPGATVAVAGTQLTGATAVTFSGTANNLVSSGFAVNGAGTQLTGLVVPAGAVTGPVTVTTPGGSSAGVQFMVLPPPLPTLTAVSPGSAPSGANITLTGTNFWGATRVDFSYYAATFTVVNSTTITAYIPYGLAVSATVTVTTPAGTSNTLTMPLLPFLLEASPIAGVAGSSCRLSGNVAGVTAVRLNGVNATFSFSNTGILTFTVPGAATSGLITVTSAGGTSNGLPFTVTRALSLSSIAPTSAATGSTIVLNGSNLTGATAIVFAGRGVNTVTSGFAVNAGGTQITGVVVPSGAETGLLSVMTPNGTATRAFTVTNAPAPVLPAWQTLTAASSGSGGNAVSITVPDASGNVYLSGTFFGQLTLGSFVLSAYGSRPLPYIAKWNPATNRYLWAKSITAYNGSISAVAANGPNVYLAGSYYDNAAFDTLAVATGGRDVFVAKLTDAGTTASFDWVKTGGGPGFDYITAMAVQGPNLYVTGSFGDSYPAGRTFNATFGNTTLVSAGQADVFVAKLVDAGATASYAWAVRAGGTEQDAAGALAVSGSTLYIGGIFFSNDAAFGSVILRNPITYGQIFQDAFVAKLTDAGSTASFGWAQQISGPSHDGVSALVAQGSNVYVSGTYINSATFGSVAVGSATAYGGGNAYVAKIMDSGSTSNFAWVKPIFCGFGSTNAVALAVSGRHIYVTGGGQDGTRFGTATLHTVSNTFDCYVAKLLDAGPTAEFAWVQQGGGSTNYDQGLALAVAGSTVLVGGYVQYAATFGPLAINSSSIDIYGFLATLTDATLLATHAPAAGPRASFDLFPNPARTATTVQLPPAATPTSAVLTLCDALGRIHRTQTVAVPAAGRQVELDLTGLAPGVYVLRIGAAVRRLVVE